MRLSTDVSMSLDGSVTTCDWSVTDAIDPAADGILTQLPDAFEDEAACAGGSGRDGGPPGPGPGAHEQAHSARRRQASGAQGRAHVTGQVNDLKDVAEDRSEAAEARERGRAGDGGGSGRETSPESLPPPPEHPLRGPA